MWYSKEFDVVATELQREITTKNQVWKLEKYIKRENKKEIYIAPRIKTEIHHTHIHKHRRYEWVEHYLRSLIIS
jgi:predicted nucleic acid-binding protein